MTALAGSADRSRRGDGFIASFPVNAASVIYKGGLVGIDTDGFARPASDTASYLVAGVACESVTGGAADGDVDVQVRFGCAFLFAASSVTQAMLNTSPAMYVVDDNTVDDAAGATNDVFVGNMVEFVSTTSCWVYVTGIVSAQALSSGITSSNAELNLNDGTTAGAAVASKTLAAGADLELAGLRRPVTTGQATDTLTVAESGTTFICAVDAVLTLPSAAANKGTWYHIVTGVASSGTGVSISPGASDAICYVTSVNNKDLINTGATDVEGDTVTLVSDGANQWWVVAIDGTWAKEA